MKCSRVLRETWWGVQRLDVSEFFALRTAAQFDQPFTRRADSQFITPHGLVERFVRGFEPVADFFQMVGERYDAREEILGRGRDGRRVFGLLVLLPDEVDRPKHRDERSRRGQINLFALGPDDK